MKNIISKVIVVLITVFAFVNTVVIPDTEIVYADELDVNEIAVEEDSGQYSMITTVSENSDEKDINNAQITGLNTSYSYIIGDVKPSFSVMFEGKTLVEGADYTLAYNNCVNAGQASITIKGINDYCGNKTVSYSIKPISIKKLQYSIPVNDPYDPYKIVFTYISANEGSNNGLWEDLVLGVDYLIEKDNGGFGNRYRFIGIGNYCDERTIEFSTYISEVNVSGLSDEYAFTGSKIKPDIRLIYNGQTLVNGVDYSLTYKNNINVGRATIAIAGIGSYQGYVKKYFNIVNNNVEAKDISKISLEGLKASYDYTGKEIIPSIVLKDSSKTLVLNKDYTIEFKNNINKGTASLTIRGIGEYYGIIDKTFSISGYNISDASIAGLVSTYKYTGNPIKPKIAVIYNRKALVLNKDYTVTYSNNINVGKATVTIQGIGDYTGSATYYFNVINDKINVSSLTIEGLKTSYVYTGKNVKPDIKVKDGDRTLREGTDYTLTYLNNTNVGKATVQIKGINDYTGTVSKTYEITAKWISGLSVNGVNTSYNYTGSAIKPVVTIQYGNMTLKQGTDYTVTYSNNINPGQATIRITGKGNYSGSVSKTFEILSNKIDISKATVTSVNSSYTYTGSVIKPSVTVKLNNKTLVNNTDYTLTYKNNTNVGTATITITGKGDYKGTLNKTFIITAKSITSFTVGGINSSYTYTGSQIKPVITVKDGSKTLQLNKDYTVTYSNNTNVGKATVKITGIGNYSGIVSKTFTIVSKTTSITSASVTGINSSYTYTGSAIKPGVTVRLNNKTLVNNTDYTLSYKNNTNVGTATITITGKGSYTGTINKTYKITAKSISSATVSGINDSYTYTGSAISPSVTVKLNNKILVNNTDYVITYSNNVNAGTATVTITGKGNYSGSITKSFAIKNNTQDSIKLTSYTLQQVYNLTNAKASGVPLNNCDLFTDYKTSYNYLNNSQLQSIKNDMLNLLNKQRNNAGLASLQLKDLGAQKWADMMANVGLYEHANSYTDSYLKNYYASGENIAFNYTYYVSNIASIATDAWNKSPGHYRIRMYSTFKYYDFGVVRCLDGTIWLVERFAR